MGRCSCSSFSDVASLAESAEWKAADAHEAAVEAAAAAGKPPPPPPKVLTKENVGQALAAGASAAAE
eukprot:COSAG01_NODE_55524_length_324_cov_1.151111_2_plen_66_part_01